MQDKKIVAEITYVDLVGEKKVPFAIATNKNYPNVSEDEKITFSFALFDKKVWPDFEKEVPDDIKGDLTQLVGTDIIGFKILKHHGKWRAHRVTCYGVGDAKKG